jgi:dephospho-CoA kinase
VQRLVEFRGFDADDARARMKLQATREQRREVAAYVVPNDGTEAELMDRIDELWSWIETKRVAQDD